MARRLSKRWLAFLRSLAFSTIIALSMNALDMVYHVLTNTAVHLNYVLVKLTIIFLTVFLVDWWVGRTWKDAVFSSVAGPTVFFVYYLVATPTLDRAAFVLDEAVWYVAVHAIALGITYWLALVGIKRSDSWRYVARGVIVGAAFTCLDLGYRMIEERLRTGVEGVLTVAVPTYAVWHLVIAVLIVTFVSWVVSDGWRTHIVSGVAVGAALGWHEIITGQVTVLGVFVDGAILGVLVVAVSVLADAVAMQEVAT